MGAGGLSWEADSLEMLKYMKTSHPAFSYSKAGQNFIAQLQAEWDKDHPDTWPLCRFTFRPVFSMEGYFSSQDGCVDSWESSCCWVDGKLFFWTRSTKRELQFYV